MPHRRQIFAMTFPTLVALGVGLLGCGDNEQKVQMPENPTPPPRPDQQLKPLTTAPPEAPSPRQDQ
jgi:hypothetical protein